MRVATASLDPVWENKAASLERCRTLAHAAAAGGAQLIVFPEMTLTGFTMNATSAAEPAAASPTIAAFAALARDCGAHIAFGVVLEGVARPRNQLVVVTREGREAARYAKVHPFTYAQEAEHYEGGDAAVSVRLDDVVFGLTVCYDLRFPELYRALAGEADVVLVIASWPAARIGHWEALLRARSLDTQAFVIGVNRTGTDGNGLLYPPSTQLYDPWGERVAAQRSEGELAWFEVDADVAREARRRFPVLRDRRPDIYAGF